MEPKLADAGLKFIGSGFHVNDYPKDSNTLPCVTQVAVGAPGEGGD
jgi:predicted nucleic acid-binding Zn ribbon protein